MDIYIFEWPKIERLIQGAKGESRCGKKVFGTWSVR
ncbi:hypothetical protein P872_23310 [Rhodonellum psychrophilum GCM71 = DSM 17998]|uniref:Uncharacterized protein n=1 Tax=Rhodonellum psychrophilum GCM71 = DSM 17998 TaxID=1123057 RepID=U5BWG9_9BACT|nr:hypothetical protein P872_23310 [Rhodonellum psychrophilum GCM71 = DSM 17998]